MLPMQEQATMADSPFSSCCRRACSRCFCASWQASPYIRATCKWLRAAYDCCNSRLVLGACTKRPTPTAGCGMTS